jgi:2-keto-4-pentenoate hydratase/2-oxohepta-3-ene-1,7-dioic acid hydratase in catechol pathway
MKLLRYGEAKKEKPGILDQAGRIRDLSAIVRDINKELLFNMDLLRDIEIDSLPVISEGVRIGPCFADAGNILCIGLNYAKHAQETNTPLPSEPVLFMKSTSAINGPYDPIILPNRSVQTDWEVELGVIIGKNAKHVSKEDALSYVAGYCVANDVSERGLQRATSQWVKGKSCDSFAPIGPWFVTADEVKDPQDLHLWLKLNGKTMQDSNTSDMIFDVATLISHLSCFMTLQAGDILFTGTPSGVGIGMTPPVFLKEGDVVELGIDGLGIQRQVVKHE